MKFYLAGPFVSYTKKEFERDKKSWDKLLNKIEIKLNLQDYSDWRDLVKNLSPFHQYIDPRDNQQYSIIAFVKQDLKSIEKSDSLIAYRPSREGKTIEMEGMSAEMGYAVKLEKPIIYVDECEIIHPFLAGISKRILRSLPALIYYLYIGDNVFSYPI
jgi:nucleoside 2-deoxyribosyltransferase